MPAPVSALAKAWASKGCRSSSPSPTPMKCTGRREFRRQRHQYAAFGGAVELGHDQAGQRHAGARRLRPAKSRSGRWWRPAPAARHGARAASSFLITRAIFSSSAIRPALFCSRPAVSMSRTSAFSARAFSSASKASPAASPPGLRGDKFRARRAAPRRPAARWRRRGTCRPPPASLCGLPGRGGAPACRWWWSCRCR